MEFNPNEHKDLTYAYRGIKEFFVDHTAQEALSEFESIIEAASTTRVWSRSTPNNLLFFMDELRKLYHYALAIDEAYWERPFCKLEISLENINFETLKTHLIANDTSATLLWNNLPRHLTYKQFANPYKALNKFANFKSKREWKNYFREIMEYALSPEKIDEVVPCTELLIGRKLVLKLIEACHLLDIRSEIFIKSESPKQPLHADL